MIVLFTCRYKDSVTWLKYNNFALECYFKFPFQDISNVSILTPMRRFTSKWWSAVTVA